MRTDHVAEGQRVRITGGPHKGRIGEIIRVGLSQPVQGYQGISRARVTIRLSNGTTVEQMPRWVEAA